MAKSKYKAGDRVKFVSHGAMFGNIGTVLFVRKDGHLIVHFDGNPEGSALFVDLTDVAPERHIAAGSAEPFKKSRAQIKREVDDILAHAVIAKDIEAAVRAAQLYIGKGLTMRFSDEQKLYNGMNRKIAAVAKRRGMDEASAYQQIMGEAKRRGGITALPGKDI